MSFLSLFVPLHGDKVLVIPSTDVPRIESSSDKPIPCGKDAQWNLTESAQQAISDLDAGDAIEADGSIYGIQGYAG